MTLPPFPSQDLAKLVLGYLAEEQLMTAYDEFLQASPYLDALKNEYDRIFMTSLRHILAEYRAVKIYVETCKPIALRKRLVQCTNLIEIVKFLVTHVDLSRIQTDTIDKTSSVQHSSVSLSKQNVCGECNLSNLSNCTCKSKQDKGNSHSGSQVEASSDASLETTTLEDLPGNQTRKKHVKVLEKEVISSESRLNKNESVKQSSNVVTHSGHASSLQTNNTHDSVINTNESSSLTGPIVKASETSGCTDKIQEFNYILKKVCKNKSSVDNAIAKECSFQSFASGVSGNDNKSVPVPDSSTSETLVPQSAIVTDKINVNADGKLFKNDSGIAQQRNNILFNYKNKPQPSDPKIKIISDIKVDSPYIMNNATSTPLMQTIVINGTPAYKTNHPIITKKNYTSDEIMAMPTIIVVTAADPSHNSTETKPLPSQNSNLAMTSTVQASKLLGPLIIDVSNPVDNNKIIQQKINTAFAHNKPAETQKSVLETGLIKTLDVTKNASVPKDNTISCSVQSNTPEILPPTRKSSSTPRRNSHIRVLDFTTPRRILQETVNENIPEENVEKNVEKKTFELVVSRSPNVIFPYPTERGNNIIDMSTVKVHKIHTCHINNTGIVNDNESSFINKKKNWDADLRLLARGSNNVEVPKKSKPKPRQPKKKTENTADSKGSEPKKTRPKRKKSPKAKRSKKRPKTEEDDEDPLNIIDGKVTVKPTFNIVSAQNKSNETENKKITDINQNKNKSDDASETPETERLCLQNEIGAKLNISDFLETPYKQVLYDIQMETPKFLGSVLPDEPISDIKITSIPTPRFFDTPKAVQNTPSSYSSRPTDYSSGGSYYKPDDQDYLRVPDLECQVTSTKPDPKTKNSEPIVQTLHEEKKSSRPVRKCAKNVSYYNNSCSNKIKEKLDDKIDLDSSCDTLSRNSSYENDDVDKVKMSNENYMKRNSKFSVKRQSECSRKRKSPLKREKANTFMKIKPRRLTPTKENITKRIRRKSDLIRADSSNITSKKKSNSREKQIHLTPIVVSAPTKSRRKSSTPRKLHCSKNFSESSSHDSPDINTSVSKASTKHDQMPIPSQDSDTEHMALRWSDDGSQDAKAKADIEDITKIQEYIITSANQKDEYKSCSATLQVDLIKRGFDAETAKIIERDLLDTPSQNEPIHQITVEVNNKKDEEVLLSKIIETDTSTSELQIVQDEESEDELELSVNECNEESENYIVYGGETCAISTQPPTKLKDKFSMEVCIDDGVAIRLRATNFNILFDNEPLSEEELAYNFKETEIAVNSISNIDRLYTPLKDHRAQVYEIFDSTLTSLDTPLKVNSPRLREYESTQIEIVIEEENVELKDSKKRKRLQSSTSSEEATHDAKKTKPETKCIFDSANIQNMDIESVLKKLHGP